VKKSLLMFSALFVLYNSFLKGQNNAPPPLPQRIVTATVVNELSFGDISLEYSSLGGSVSVTPTGTRHSTGDIILMNMGLSYSPAELSFRLCPGRSIKVVYDPVNYLTFGSYSMSMVIDDIIIGNTTISASGQNFTSNKGCNDTHLMKVGGTLTVGQLSANNPGYYSGSFTITLAQE
jgi:Domain of unknown function (DUF4402)